MPTANEAGSIFGAMMVLLFVLSYALPLVVSDPTSPIRQVHLLPYTAFLTCILRNGLGSLPGWQACTVSTELIVLGALVLLLAVRIFRHAITQHTS